MNPEDEPYNFAPAVMSKALRRKQQLGTLGMLSGDPVLAPLGQNLGADAGSEAWKDTQDQMHRQNVLSRAMEARQDRGFRKEQTESDQGFMAEQNRLNRGLEMSIARIRADAQGAAGTKYRDFTANNIKELNEQVAEVGGINDLVGGFSDDYARIGAPGGRDTANWFASKGMGTENSKAAQQWWASWDRIYTLPVRNEIFGSALTTTEQAAWEKANISPDMTPKQIRDNLKIIAGLKSKATKKLSNDFKVANYDPEAVDYIFGEGFGGEEEQPASAAGAESGKGGYSIGQLIEHPNGKTYRVIGGSPEDPDVEEVN